MWPYAGGKSGLALVCSTRLRTNLQTATLPSSSRWQKCHARQRGASPEALPASDCGHNVSVLRAVFPAPGPPVINTPTDARLSLQSPRASKHRRNFSRAHSRQ